jgi:conjugative transfer region protein TrbK
MNLRLPARVGAFACLGVAVTMAALSLRDTGRPAPVSPGRQEPAPHADPLQARLLRCQQAGGAAGSDGDCLAAWAENRRRFLGLDRSGTVEPARSPVISHVPPSPAPPAATADAAAQPQEH